ncbi:ATP-dependent nuclease [Nocardioides caldifontis]|uniref:ATP-dependent nuclease n=1 Tax=Nocardioides caldifontis TaxID=2588938 RepID=UPI0011DFC5AA|nr:AAA family ATPase [Nocardioides caldifontis]
MRVRRIRIRNFRGVKEGELLLDGHTLLVGANSIGKSTICEALDLVLGPERMLRRPVVDEYDFHDSRYLTDDDTGDDPSILIEVVLVDLSARAERRFGGHLRKWNHELNDFADTQPDTIDLADAHPWCLPLLFCGRFNPAEDDFEGGTFFAHPEPVVDDLATETDELGGGRRVFTRDDKRHCGYLYLRPNRTGSRALSFQRGSLLDTIIRLETDTGLELWEKVRKDLAEVDLAAGSSLESTLDGVEDRIARFLSLSATGEDVQVHPSDLTRENIRETLRVFIASNPGSTPVPFNRLSTGSLNLLVFALLTYIAELKGDDSVIFAMEEPEIAIPPHAQRRLVDFVTRRMGQAIVTSHSPYVIERFTPESLLVVSRDPSGKLSGRPIELPTDFKVKRYRENRRQFAEAVLARAVLVVEGATEAALIPVVSDVLDADSSLGYTHLDLAGISVFDAGNDSSVPLYAPLFKSLGKPVYGIHDTPTTPFDEDRVQKTDDFTHYQEIPYAGVEDLLVAEVPAAVKRRFLATVSTREDYPVHCGYLAPGSDDDAVDHLVRKVLIARKGANDGYAPLLVGEARDMTELPASLVAFLTLIDADLAPAAVPTASTDLAGDPSAAASPGESQPTDEPANSNADSSGAVAPSAGGGT